jgi:DNA mismatch endonuclease (patch repair protein)
MPDNLTPEQRKRAMSNVKQKDTDIERKVRSKLHLQGYRFRKHVSNLPGKPDIVFSTTKVVVFIDGDFWHGYRFSRWANDVSDFWRNKISRNRCRDQKNFRQLRRMGWSVIRLWKHEINRDLDSCVNRITNVIESCKELRERR